MAKKITVSKKRFSADWLLFGVLAKVGDTLDQFTGRNWTPSSSLATSEIIERIKKLLDAETRDVPGKGLVVPHDIKLKVEWDKFSTDAEDLKTSLENELLAATSDHINDSLYYTFAPLSLTVEPDYFIEGVRLAAGFGEHVREPDIPDLNVTIAGISLGQLTGKADTPPPLQYHSTGFIVRFTLNGSRTETRLDIAPGQSISIGRAASNGVVLDDSSVSKIHASLAGTDDRELLLADTGSTNGTFLNGERIAYGKAIRINDADKVCFGDVEVSFERAEAEASKEDSVAIDGLEFTSRTDMDKEPQTDKEDAVTDDGAAR